MEPDRCGLAPARGGWRALAFAQLQRRATTESTNTIIMGAVVSSCNPCTDCATATDGPPVNSCRQSIAAAALVDHAQTLQSSSAALLAFLWVQTAASASLVCRSYLCSYRFASDAGGTLTLAPSYSHIFQSLILPSLSLLCPSLPQLEAIPAHHRGPHKQCLAC
eukprot:SAG31_NODE_6732_length_1907_cov_1.478429_2_plen_164_part_00